MANLRDTHRTGRRHAVPPPVLCRARFAVSLTKGEESFSSPQNKIKMRYYTGDIVPDGDTVFVFGSNPEGRHGAGAAHVALTRFHAKYGQGEGLQGYAYAIPTKDLRVKENNGYRSIPRQRIVESIRKMYSEARYFNAMKFCIAYRNTDRRTLNGYTGYEMIRMFIEAGPIPDNVYVSEEWYRTGLFN